MLEVEKTGGIITLGKQLYRSYMTSINKESVREEFDKIKQSFQDLVAAGKVTPETSLRVNKKNYWVHVYSAGYIALKMLHEKRGK